MQRLRRSGTRGLSLLELLVAITVLSIGTLGAMRAADQARLAIGGEMPRLLAGLAARNRAEELRLLGPYARGLPETVSLGGRQFTLSLTREATVGGLIRTRVTARAATGEAASLLLYLVPGGPPS